MAKNTLKKTNTAKFETDLSKDQRNLGAEALERELQEIHLGEKLDINNVQQLKDKISGAVSSKTNVKLICKSCEVIDLSFIQMIYALKMDKRNGKIETAITLSPDQTELIKNTGLYTILFPSDEGKQLN
jgi:anti-anti-sigma regulatory factor